MTKKQKAPKPRNPNDATFRNITALKLRVTQLEDEMASLRSRVDDALPELTPSTPDEAGNV